MPEETLGRSTRAFAVAAVREAVGVCLIAAFVACSPRPVGRTIGASENGAVSAVDASAGVTTKADVLPPTLAGPSFHHVEWSPLGRWVRLDGLIVDPAFAAATPARVIAEIGNADTMLAFSPDAGHVVVLGNGSARILALPSATIIQQIDSTVERATWSPDGREVAWSEQDGTVRWLDVTNGKKASLARPLVDAKLALGNQHLIVDEGQSRSGPHDLRIVLTATGAEIARIHDAGPSTWLLDGAANKILLSDFASRPSLRVFDLATLKTTALSRIRVPPYPKGVCGDSQSWEVATFHAQTGRASLFRECSGNDSANIDLASGRVVFSTELDGDAISGEWVRAERVLKKIGAQRHQTFPSWSTVGGASVLLAPLDEGIVLLDEKTAAHRGRLEDSRLYDGDRAHIAVAPQGSLVAGIDDVGRARVWSTASGKVLWSSAPRPETVARAVFAAAPTGGSEDLVTISDRGTLRRWNLATSALRSTVELTSKSGACRVQSMVARSDGRVAVMCVTTSAVDVFLDGSASPLTRAIRDGQRAVLDPGGRYLAIIGGLGDNVELTDVAESPRASEHVAVPAFTYVEGVAGDLFVGRNAQPPQDIVVWSYRTGATALTVPNSPRAKASFTTGARSLLVDRETQVDLVALFAGAPTQTFAMAGLAYNLDVSAQGDLLAAASHHAVIVVSAGDASAPVRLVAESPTFAAWSSRGRSLVYSSGGSGAEVVDLDRGTHRTFYAVPFTAAGAVITTSGVVLSGDRAGAALLLTAPPATPLVHAPTGAAP